MRKLLVATALLAVAIAVGVPAAIAEARGHAGADQNEAFARCVVARAHDGVWRSARA